MFLTLDRLKCLVFFLLLCFTTHRWIHHHNNSLGTWPIKKECNIHNNFWIRYIVERIYIFTQTHQLFRVVSKIFERHARDGWRGSCLEERRRMQNVQLQQRVSCSFFLILWLFGSELEWTLTLTRHANNFNEHYLDLKKFRRKYILVEIFLFQIYYCQNVSYALRFVCKSLYW